MNSSDNIYLAARINESEREIQCTVDSYICLFVSAYCDFQFDLNLVDESGDYQCSVDLKVLQNVNYKCVSGTDKLFKDLSLSLPAIQANSKNIHVGGICAVLRYALKLHLSAFPGHYSNILLGFRGGCLVACTESSMWTKFCELQLPNSVSEIKAQQNDMEKCTTIPANLVLLEAHLKRPVRTHNILKKKQNVIKEAKKMENCPMVTLDYQSNACNNDIKFTIYDSQLQPLNEVDIPEALETLVINEKSEEFSLNHNYLEGIDLTLADLVVFPCVHTLLENLPPETMKHLDAVWKWYKRMCLNSYVQKAFKACGLKVLNQELKADDNHNITVPLVDKNSLYRKDPIHTKLKVKHRSPSKVLALIENASIFAKYSNGYCESLDWKNLPSALHPLTGDLPEKRVVRKCQQVESIVTAALKIASDGQTIVEFCAGGGHVGLLLAYFLPNCKVIFIENKESSISRAMNRAEALKLKNVYFYQCNLDYFRGSFDLGVSLHACGVATDLVIQQCIKQRASFVCCPCCYGNIQNTHLLSYPLSSTFRAAGLSLEQYILLAHCADRTEVNTATADQGELCMGLIDTDRVFMGEEYGYEVNLTRMQPLSCSPKHNLLIGCPVKCERKCL